MLFVRAYQTATADNVTESFLETAEIHGLPAAILSDNGPIFTTRFAGKNPGPNKFQKTLKQLGVKEKHGLPGKPTTQGKVERWHRTLQQMLRAKPTPANLAELNKQLTEIQHEYNHVRPHTGAGRKPPIKKYYALPKAEPTLDLNDEIYRVRIDKVCKTGKVTLRYLGDLKHLSIGREWTGQRVVTLVTGNRTLVILQSSGEVIAQHIIDKEKNYQRKKEWFGL